MRKWIGIVLLLCLLGGGFGLYTLYPYYRLYRLKDARAMPPTSPQKAVLTIPSHSTLTDVVKLLSQKKWLVNEKDFHFFAKAKHYTGRRVVAGRYHLQKTMTYNQLVNHLRGGRGRRSVKVAFHYVRNLEQLAKRVASQLEPDTQSFSTAFANTAFSKKYGFTKATFGTMFLPDTYQFNWATNAQDFVKKMRQAYQTFWKGKHDRRAKELKMSRIEVSILASIVQAEQSKKRDEWPKIAGLYMNRLRRGMKLEADPTVKFALGQPGLRRILFKHLKVDSPYNTYRHKGLPPGPLNIPEKGAILAVLYHQQHDYIYMCAKPGYAGYHNFAKTLRQHKKYARQYHRWLKKEGIR